MRLYYVRVDSDSENSSSKTWLIIAGDEAEACNLAPVAGVQPPTIESVRDLPREQTANPGVIGWVGNRPAAFA